MDQIYVAFAQAVVNANAAYVAADFKQPAGFNVQQFAQGKLETNHGEMPSYSQTWISNASYATNIAMHNYKIGNIYSKFDTVTGGDYNDVLYGVVNESLTLNGEAGDDILVATGAKNQSSASVDGGLGNDFIALGTTFVNTTSGDFLTYWHNLLNGLPVSQLQSVMVREPSQNIDNYFRTYYHAWGGAGDDTILGSESHDIITGDDGNDYLFGEGQEDFMRGCAGNDVMSGGAGDDSVYGGLGHDYIEGGDGKDHLYGGDIAAR